MFMLTQLRPPYRTFYLVPRTTVFRKLLCVNLTDIRTLSLDVIIEQLIYARFFLDFRENLCTSLSGMQQP